MTAHYGNGCITLDYYLKSIKHLVQDSEGEFSRLTAIHPNWLSPKTAKKRCILGLDWSDSIGFNSCTEGFEIFDIVRQDCVVEDLGHRSDVPVVRPDTGVPSRTVVCRCE